MLESKEEAMARRTAKASKLTWLFICVLSATIAIFGKGGFSNTSSQVAHALERVLFLILPITLVSLFLAHIIVGITEIYRSSE